MHCINMMEDNPKKYISADALLVKILQQQSFKKVAEIFETMELWYE